MWAWKNLKKKKPKRYGVKQKHCGGISLGDRQETQTGELLLPWSVGTCKTTKRYAKIGRHQMKSTAFRHQTGELWEKLTGCHCIVIIMIANTPGITGHLVHSILFKWDTCKYKYIYIPVLY